MTAVDAVGTTAAALRDNADAVIVEGLRVTVTESNRVIVNDVALTVARGEIVGLVGESGSGKSTIGTALLGATRQGAAVVGGRVRVAGLDARATDAATRGALRGTTVGYVPQDPGAALDPVWRIGDQIIELLREHKAPGDHAERAAAALADVGLPNDPAFLRRYPHQLSGGQQQRVQIALAVLLEPAVIVFDEPTTGLDVSSQSVVLRLIRRLCAEHGIAALYITHDLAVVAQLCDRVLVLRDGSVVERGRTEQVLTDPEQEYTRALIRAVPDLASQPRSAPTASVGASSLEVSGLRVAYGSTVAVHDATFTLGRGECLAVVGESGSGKSTLSRSIVGLHPAAAGEVRLDGRLLDRTARGRSGADRRSLQYVFQSPHASLNPRRRIGEMLASPRRHFFGEPRRIAEASAAAALQRVGLTDRVATLFPGDLSGGERQRVAIARALLCEPTVLLCDEITSALDVTVQAEVIALLRLLQDRDGVALLFVTHNLALVAEIAHRVLVMQNGRIVEQGTTETVLRTPAHRYTRSLLEDTPQLEVTEHPSTEIEG